MTVLLDTDVVAELLRRRQAQRWKDGSRVVKQRICTSPRSARRAEEKAVRPLNWDLQRLVREHRGGSFSTRRARSHALAQAADTLAGLGFRGLRAKGLKPKHVEALVAEWRRQGLAAGTVKNRMAHLRWWAGRVGKAAGVVKADNAAYGIGDRRYVTNEDRSRIWKRNGWPWSATRTWRWRYVCRRRSDCGARRR